MGQCEESPVPRDRVRISVRKWLDASHLTVMYPKTYCRSRAAVFPLHRYIDSDDMAVNDQTSALEKIWPHKSALGFSKRILGDAGAPDRLTGLYRGETRINNYGNQPGNLEAKALVSLVSLLFSRDFSCSALSAGIFTSTSPCTCTVPDTLHVSNLLLELFGLGCASLGWAG